MQTPWPDSNGISATYSLHCHCGAVKYNITVSPPLYKEHAQGKEQWQAVECNCSHCERTGAINVHPFSKDVEFTQGKENMVEYRCAGKKNPHFNCRFCGCFLVTNLEGILGEMGMESRYAVNVSCYALVAVFETHANDGAVANAEGL